VTRIQPEAFVIPSHFPQHSADATILATSTAVPPHVITRDDVRYYLGRVFDIPERRVDAMLNIVANAQVDKRHVLYPIDYTIEPRSLAKTNQEYIEHSVALGQQVAERSLAKAGMKPTDVDLLLTVSCTGFMIPSLDAHLINRMGFRPDVRRMAFTELGCAAGAMALARAHEFLRAYPGSNVQVIAVELPSLTFQRRDLSQANLISCVLFGDGAAAALVTGGRAPGPRILASATYTFPDSLDAMGFDLRDSGFHIVLSRDVPRMVREKIGGLVDAFLASHDLSRKSIAAWILHPGGQKLLGNIEEELGLCRCDTQFSWDVLGEYGNLSSATILFILNEWLDKRPMNTGDYGLVAAFGPGFSAELLLLQWT
jgi:alkylresorcinol/alkylpyrone synthase